MNPRVVCGLQPVREAVRVHASRLDRVLVQMDASQPSPQLEALARFARDRGTQVDRVSRGELDRIARGVRHQGAIAFAPQLAIRSLEQVTADAGIMGAGMIVALDEVQDPQNFGALIRSAVAMGAACIVWTEHRSAPLSSATFRASAGAVEHATLCRVASLPNALGDLRAHGMKVFGLDVGAEIPIRSADLTGPLVLVVGAEDKGLRKTVKRACDTLARLPMPGPIGSLNLSVAVAIAMYEALRQRGSP